jgi:hypothetical protein
MSTGVPTDTNKVIFTGENPGIKLMDTDEQTVLTAASFWRTILSPVGPGCVLFIQSKDFTNGEWAIWSDNIALARWFQTTQLTASTPADTTIPVVSAAFESSGDANYFWTETATSSTGDILEMTWTDIGDPLVIHNLPAKDKYGVISTLIPTGESRLTLNGVQASGKAYPTKRPDGIPWSTSFLAFSETWTKLRANL